MHQKLDDKTQQLLQNIQNEPLRKQKTTRKSATAMNIAYGVDTTVVITLSGIWVVKSFTCQSMKPLA